MKDNANLIANELSDYLSDFLYIDPEQAYMAASILLGLIAPEDLPQMDRVLNEFYNPPERDHMKLLALNLLIEGHGIETVDLIDVDLFYSNNQASMKSMDFDIMDHQKTATYINTGDTYNATIAMIDGEFYLTTIGDLVENAEKKAYADLYKLDKVESIQPIKCGDFLCY